MAQIKSPNCQANSSKENSGSLGIFKIALLGAFLLLQIYLFFLKKYEIQHFSTSINEVPLPLFGDNKSISQEFYSPSSLSRIDIMLANYKVKPKGGILRLSIFDIDNNRLILKNYWANTVEDNQYYSFFLNSHQLIAGKYRMKLNFFPKNNKDKLAVWTCKEDRYPQGNLYVNDQIHQGDMTFRIYYSSTIWKEKSRWLYSKSQSSLKIRNFALMIGLLFFLFTLNALFIFFLKKI